MTHNHAYLKCEWCDIQDESVKDVEYLPEGESFTRHADLCEGCEDSLEYVPEPETTHIGNRGE